MAETVLYDKQDHIVTITLNRPDALNSINRQLRQEFGEAIQRFDGEQDSYVAIITGVRTGLLRRPGPQGAGRRQR